MAREVVLNTNFAQIVTSCGPVNVAGGVFTFRNVDIPAGVTVRGEGSNPLILLCAGRLRVDGTLSVRGGDGVRVDTLHSANFPTPGGIGVCAGSDGGRGSPNVGARSLRGERGWFGGNLAQLGGEGGHLGCFATCERGSGGGGGSFATAGDPYYKILSSGTSAVQQLGIGGFGCTQRTLPGGQPGLVPFVDGRADNDFFGVGVDFFGRRFVQGELTRLVGGEGAGGGGDRSPSCDPNDPNFVNDAKGGGGGAGGGVVAVVALGRVTVGPRGRISADGGNGGGGEQAGSNNRGGGGGGGAGGLVLLASFDRIELWAHGETYANNDYDFSVSADGGIGTQGAFGSIPIAGKYPPPPLSALDSRPSGGLGGMGIVELMSPIGTNRDRTNTVLDDGIDVILNNQVLTGRNKQRYLAWRGYLDAAGRRVDDNGLPTNIGANEGDIRPSPVLLPVLR